MATERLWYDANIDRNNPVEVFRFNIFEQPSSYCKIDGPQQIASYNWFEEDTEPVIVVPGAPREFYNNEDKVELIRDSGTRITDENIYRMPQNPLDPLFYAYDNQSETEVNFQQIEIVTDRINLIRLYCAISPTTNSPVDPFRIEMKRLGKCILFFNCVENSVENADTT